MIKLEEELPKDSRCSMTDNYKRWIQAINHAIKKFGLKSVRFGLISFRVGPRRWTGRDRDWTDKCHCRIPA